MNLYNEYMNTKMQYQSMLTSNIVRKWKPVIISYIDIDNDVVNEKLCLFAEYYQLTYDKISSFQVVSTTFQNNISKDIFDLKTSFQHIIDELKIFIVENDFTKLKIIEEYYNVMTGKKGMLLDGGIRIEDGKLLNPKHQKKIDSELIKNIDRSIEFVLKPEMRNMLLRTKKIERIIN